MYPFFMERKMSKMKIGIITGHGQNHHQNKLYDVGASSSKWGTEANMVRDLAPRLKRELEKYKGVTVDILDTSKNWYDFLKYKGYDFSKYDYIIELHANAGAHDPNGNGATTGVECWVTPREKAVSVEQCICNEVSKLGFKNRGVKRENFLVINCIKDDGVSAVLIECGFIDDNDDMKLLFGNKDGFAKAIATGVAKGFKLTAKPQEPAKPTNPATPSKPSAKKYTLVVSCKTYVSADNAKNRKGSVGEYKAGSYYVYKNSNGMINVTKNVGKPGAWINPADNKTSVKPKKTAKEIAKEIYNGICSDPRWSTWGTGSTRESRLKQAGYNPSEVQKEVNKLF